MTGRQGVRVRDDWRTWLKAARYHAAGLAERAFDGAAGAAIELASRAWTKAADCRELAGRSVAERSWPWHRHDMMVTGRYVHRPGGLGALGTGAPMPCTVAYRTCTGCEMPVTAQVLPGVVPVLALMGIRTEEVREAFDAWSARDGAL